MLMKEQNPVYKIDYRKYAQQELKQDIPVSKETSSLIASLFPSFWREQVNQATSLRHFLEEAC